MTKNIHQSKQQGFTIIELLLALAVFSFVLVFITTAFLQLFRTYTRGVTRKEVNQSARLLIDDMSNRLRTVTAPSQVNTSQVNKGRLCVGGYSYVWNPVKRPLGWIDNKVNNQVVNVVRLDGDNGSVACDPAVTNITVGAPTSMFSDRVGVQSITITPIGQVPDLFQISTTVTIAQQDLLDALNRCTTESLASPYCSQVTLQSTVGLRNR